MSRRTILGSSAALMPLLVTSTVALAFAAGLPASTYPPPVPAKPGAAFTACPNPVGLQRFDDGAVRLAERIAVGYGHVSLAADLVHSDRSWSLQLHRAWRSVEDGHRWIGFSFARGVQLGGPRMYWSGVVRYYCGSRLLVDSLSVFVGRRKVLNCDCNGVNLLFVDRRGVPLVYDVH
jgi:hypothetical protein